MSRFAARIRIRTYCKIYGQRYNRFSKQGFMSLGLAQDFAAIMRRQGWLVYITREKDDRYHLFRRRLDS